ncbi:MAG: glycosyltransferase family 4 protein [Rhizobiales bacterium]|nr:glycosyltransferase family 4 protein [Rhizobacter sp.]
MRSQAAPGETADSSLGVLIVGDNVSAMFGGEAILPLHYFRLLRDRGFRVWLITHARTRAELSVLFPDESRILYVEDNALHKLLWRLGRPLPARLAYVTTGFVSRVAVQAAQRRIARRLIAREHIDIVHQPVPVSPREPSLIFGLGAPVIIGPMNGGMDYPPSFRPRESGLEALFVRLGRRSAELLNAVMPGKRRAALLLVANERTRAALPPGLCGRVEKVVENGVELDLWTRPGSPRCGANPSGVTRFAFVGRLIDLKAVDLLLDAFASASAQAPMQLVVIGDGEERERLGAQAARLFPAAAAGKTPVRFTGWIRQSECARELTNVDCLVMPSLRDCGGAVVLEAMAMSMPVIATAWGGPLDYLDESCGILIPPRDRETLVNDLARAMVRLATAPLERAAMGRAGRAKIEQIYSWDVKANHMIQLYRQVLARPAVRRT